MRLVKAVWNAVSEPTALRRMAQCKRCRYTAVPDFPTEAQAKRVAMSIEPRRGGVIYSFFFDDIIAGVNEWGDSDHPRIKCK